MRRPLALLLTLVLAAVPGTAFAEDSGDAEASAASPPQAPVIPPVDDIGRPFPDPLLVKRAKLQTGFGVASTIAGGVMMAGGLFYGSAVARGEIQGGNERFVALGGLFGGGVLALNAGLPTLSVGVFTTKQLDRTIKGAAKVPRTVANEKRYWDAVMAEHVGRTIAINGGGTLLLGVVAIAGVAATIDTEFYDARYWAAVAGTLGGGAGVVALGVLLERKARERQEAVWDEVDPYRRKEQEVQGAAEGELPPVVAESEPVIAPPVPMFAPVPPTASSPAGMSFGLSWSFAL